MTSIKLLLKTELNDAATRESGALLRNKIVEYLQRQDLIEIDFTDVILTPSFSDEAFGLLCHHMSYADFNKNIKLVNLSLSQKALLTRVIANRFSISKP